LGILSTRKNQNAFNERQPYVFQLGDNYSKPSSFGLISQGKSIEEILEGRKDAFLEAVNPHRKQ